LNVVGYVRLSRDENKESYASIQAQKEIIENYANTHKLKISKFFEDDDVSGYKFNSRQAFNEMMSELEEGKIDVIICKDLSRIGRHNAHTLLFLETIKDLNKTLIAIDDNYDSSKDNDDIIGIKTWYNERYVKDLSQKIRSNIQSHMRKNEYLNQVPYGYKIDQFDNIVVDDVVKDIIQKIFQLYIEGNGFLKIARYLNQNNIPAPFERMRQIAEEEGKIYKRKSSNKWNDSTVQNILKNDFYIGIKRLGKTKREKVHGKRQLTTENQQHIFENNHEAIISPQDFYLVQEIMQKRKA
jgi:DNA invertase Pin-like site-specific DNA recombinase